MCLAAMANLRLLSVFLSVLVVFVDSAAARGRHYYRWENAHATFYGGASASGTMGGACGYGNLYDSGYGTLTAAASSAIWNDGFLCGACYQVQCYNTPGWKWCKSPTKTVTVTVTNNCPNGSEGGWCNPPKKHLDMAYPSFAELAPMKAGIVYTHMRRVPCVRKGLIRYVTGGNPWFLQVNIQNVAASGDIRAVLVQGGNGGWKPMLHNWGATWSINAALMGKPVHFRITSGLTGQTITVMNALPSNWAIGGKYHAGQFPMPRPKRGR